MSVSRNIFSNLIHYIKSGFLYLLNIPTVAKKRFDLFVYNIGKLQYNIKNFAETNTRLGIHHLNKQNYNDAIFRFILVDKFSLPNDPFINYWLGWAYLLKGNHKQAILRLEKGVKEDKIGLLNFVKKIDNTTKVPNEIYSIYRNIAAQSIIGDFLNYNGQNLAKQLVVQMVKAIDELPNEKPYILELGSNIGLIGSELQKRMSGTFVLTGVESSSKMLDLQRKIGQDAMYKKLANLPIEDYLFSTTEENYDIVISLDGFANNSNLSDLFTKVRQILKPQGYFAFTVKTGSSVDFPRKKLEFSYDKNHITSLLSQNYFKIITSLDLGLKMKNNYSIICCKKLDQSIKYNAN